MHSSWDNGASQTWLPIFSDPHQRLRRRYGWYDRWHQRIGVRHLHWSLGWLAVAIASWLIGQAVALPTSVSADATSLDLVVTPSVWTVTSRSSGANAIALKGTGFSGSATLTVSGLPSTILSRYPSGSELAAGQGGYYCSSHCQAASNSDFPVPLTLTDGQWMSVGPTLLAGSSTPTQSATVTVTATANGQSVSRSFTLKIVNDEYVMPDGGGPPTQAGTANPDVIVTVNNAAFNEHRYKVNLTAGQTKTMDVNVVNNSSSPLTATLTSNLTSSGLSDVTTGVTGGLSTSSLSLAASETKTVSFTVTTQSTTLNGSYEFVLGVAQADGSNRAGLGISTIVTGGATGVPSPTSTPAPASSPSSTSSSSNQESSASTSTTAASAATEPSKPTPQSTTAGPSVSIESSKLAQAAKPASVLHLLPSAPATIAVTPTKATVKRATVTIGGTETVLKSSDGGRTYAGALTTPTTAGEHAATATVSYQDGSAESTSFSLLIDPYGYVFERIAAGEQRIAGATVTLEQKNGEQWGRWDAATYDQTNPQITKGTGEFAFFVPPGTYRLRAEAAGFEPFSGPEFAVTDAVIHTNLELKRTGASPLPTGSPSEPKILRQLRAIVAPIVSEPTAVVTRRTTDLVAATVVVASSTLPLATSLPLLDPFGSIMAWLLGLASLRRRSRPWGKVVDATTGQPVALATVRLFATDRTKLLATSSTDATGRFSFLPSPGAYRIEVVKVHYRFPSESFTSQYHGGPIHVGANHQLDLTIALDPELTTLSRRISVLVRLRALADRLRLPLLLIGTLFTIVFTVTTPDLLNQATLAAYAIAWLATGFHHWHRRPAGGDVIDRATKQTLEFAIVRLFNHVTGKLVETTVTDTTGHYRLLTDPGSYHASVACDAYQPLQSEPWQISRSASLERRFALTRRAGGSARRARDPDPDPR